MNIEQDIVTQEELEFIEKLNLDLYEDYEREKAQLYDEICEVCKEVHERYQVISFGPKTQIINEELSNELDPKQTEMAFAAEMPKLISKKHVTTIRIGGCGYCGTEHFECQNCKTITCAEDSEDDLIYCDGCGTPYFVENASYDDPGGPNTYRVLASICEKCSDNIDHPALGKHVCESCEHDYPDKTI